MKLAGSSVSPECRQKLLLLSYQLAYPTLALVQPVQHAGTSPVPGELGLSPSHCPPYFPLVFPASTPLLHPDQTHGSLCQEACLGCPCILSTISLFLSQSLGCPPQGGICLDAPPHPCLQPGRRLCVGLTQIRCCPTCRLTLGQSLLDFSEPQAPHAYTGHLKSASHCLW